MSKTDFADIQNKKECGGNRQWQRRFLRNWAANTSGKLNTYLADIDRQAQERFERLIEGMKQAQNGTPKGRKRLRMGTIHRAD